MQAWLGVPLDGRGQQLFVFDTCEKGGIIKSNLIRHFYVYVKIFPGERVLITSE